MRKLIVLVNCIFWYLCSALSNNIAKSLFGLYRCPVTLSWLQFGFVAFYSIIYAYLLHRFPVMSGLSLSGSWGRGRPPQSSLSSTLIGHRGDVLPTASSSTAPGEKSLMMAAMTDYGVSSATSGSIGDGILNRHSHLFGPAHPPVMRNVRLIFPLTLFLITGHVFSSVAIASASVSFVHTVKALSPLFTVIIYSIVLGESQYSFSVYLSLVPLTLGVMLACAYDVTFDAVGLICSLLSTLIFVMQNIFSKKLFQRKALDKLSMLFYASFSSFILMTPFWMSVEGSAASGIWNSSKREVILGLFFLNGVFHFLQNIAAFILLSMVSPVTYSIASLFKRIVVIVTAIAWFGLRVYTSQLFGIVLTFVGLWAYNQARVRDSHQTVLTPERTTGKRSPPDSLSNLSGNTANMPTRPKATGKTGIDLYTQVLDRVKSFDVIRDVSSDSLYSLATGKEPQI